MENSSHPSSRALPALGLAILVWSAAVIFYFYETLLTMSPSVMVNDLMHDFQANREQIGYIIAFYSFAYAFMQIPAGMLMDRFGPHRLLTLASLLCAIGCFGFAAADNWQIATLTRFMMGLGGGFAVVGCLKVASLWFAPKRFALLTGLMVALGMLGAAAGQKPLALLIEQGLTWRTILGVSGIVGLVMAAVIWFTMHHEPHDEIIEGASFKDSVVQLFSGLKTVLQDKQTWLASLYASLMFVPTLAFGGSWGVSYWEQVLGVETSVAAGYNSLIFIGWAFGGPAYGWLSDHIGLRKPFLLFAAVATLLTLSIILYGHSLGAPILIASIFLLGFFSSGFVLVFSLVRESHKSEATATAAGFVNTLNTLGGAIVIPVVGMLIDSKMSHTVGVDLLEAYTDSFGVIIGCLVLALVLLPFVKETYCKTKV